MKSTKLTTMHASMLRIVDEAYEKKAWHGPNLKGSVRGVTASQASWLPAPGRHAIWDIVIHAAYWKYAVRQRLVGGKRGAFPKKGSNWFARPYSRPETAWKHDVALLDDMHRNLRSAIASLPPDLDLHKKVPGIKSSYFTLIFGVAAHDLYHAGQIQLLKRLQKKKGRRS